MYFEIFKGEGVFYDFCFLLKRISYAIIKCFCNFNLSKERFLNEKNEKQRKPKKKSFI